MSHLSSLVKKILTYTLWLGPAPGEVDLAETGSGALQQVTRLTLESHHASNLSEKYYYALKVQCVIFISVSIDRNAI